MDAILEYADEQDWESLETPILERIPTRSEWQRENLVNIHVAREEQNGRLEQAQRLIRGCYAEPGIFMDVLVTALAGRNILAP